MLFFGWIGGLSILFIMSFMSASKSSLCWLFVILYSKCLSRYIKYSPCFTVRISSLLTNDFGYLSVLLPHHPFFCRGPEKFSMLGKRGVTFRGWRVSKKRVVDFYGKGGGGAKNFLKVIFICWWNVTQDKKCKL